MVAYKVQKSESKREKERHVGRVTYIDWNGMIWSGSAAPDHGGLEQNGQHESEESLAEQEMRLPVQ